MIESFMKEDFKFQQIGKRMPYTMPEGFLKDMEKNVLCAVSISSEANNKKRPKLFYSLFRSAVAAAAVATLFVVSYKTMSPRPVSNRYHDVETAFDNLSYEDQEYMLETNSDDVFFAANDY